MAPTRRKSEKSTDEFARASRAAKFIQSKTKLRPRIGLVLGSGLGAFADELSSATRIPYHKIPGFPRSTVEGHAGQQRNTLAAGCDITLLIGENLS